MKDICDNHDIFKDGSRYKIKIPKSNLSEMSGPNLSEAKLNLKKLYIDSSSLFTSGKNDKDNTRVNMKVSHSKRPSEIKSHIKLINSTTGFKNSLEINSNKENISYKPYIMSSKNFTVKMKNSINSQNIISPFKEFDLSPNLINHAHTKSENINFPKIIYKFRNDNSDVNSCIWRSDLKADNLAYEKFRMNFNHNKMTHFDVKTGNRNSFSMINYMKLKKEIPCITEETKSKRKFSKEINMDNTKIIYVPKNIENFKNSSRSIKNSKLDIYTKNSAHILNNPKISSHHKLKYFINNSSENKHKKNSNSIVSLKTLKGNPNKPILITRNIKIKNTDETKYIDSSENNLDSDYLTHLHNNISIEYQKNYPGYKEIKQSVAQKHMNDALSTQHFTTTNRLNLIIKKPYFHVNKNLCFPFFLEDRHMLLKIHNKNMKSLEKRLTKFKLFEKN